MLDLFMLLDEAADITCGGIVMDPIIPAITSTVVSAIKYVVPIILVVFGMIDLMKAVTAGDEKVMKETQKLLVKRIIYAVLIFLVVAIVQTVFKTLNNANSSDEETPDAADEGNSPVSCISCFISGDCDGE